MSDRPRQEEINIEEIMASIRREVARRSAEIDSKGDQDFVPPMHWSRLDSYFHEAQQYLDTAAAVPSMEHHPKPLRTPARGLSRVVRYLLTFVLVPLTRVNKLLLQMLKMVDHGIDQLAESVNELSEEHSVQNRRISSALHRLERLEENPPARNRSAGEGRELFLSRYPDFLAYSRGSREAVRTQLERYLPIVQRQGEIPESKPILDLGCGRGEWLELIKKTGLPVLGIDHHPDLVDVCRQLNLPVQKADLLDFLRNAEEGSFQMVTAFQVLERLEFDYLMQCLHEATRVLSPGGVILIETPNPETERPFAPSRFSDPTLLQPLPGDLLEFLLKSFGMESVELLPDPASKVASDPPKTEFPELSPPLGNLVAMGVKRIRPVQSDAALRESSTIP